MNRVYLGVPVQIGAGGIERVLELELSEKEKREMQASANHVQEPVSAMDRMLAQAT